MAKKIILIVFGAVALVIALPLLIGGAALLAVGGHSGTLLSGFHQVSTSSVALVANPDQVRGNGNAVLQVSGASLRVAGQGSGRPLFLGVGPAAQVTDYLSGASYDTITRVMFSPFRLTTTHVDGTGRPAAPADQSFWVAQATGTTPEMSWKVTGGDYLVVAMNADASPGVAFDAQVGLSAGVIFDAALGFTVAGGVLLLLGLALLIWGIAAKRSPPAAPGYAYPPPFYRWPPPPGAPPPDMTGMPPGAPPPGASGIPPGATGMPPGTGGIPPPGQPGAPPPGMAEVPPQATGMPGYGPGAVPPWPGWTPMADPTAEAVPQQPAEPPAGPDVPDARDEPDEPPGSGEGPR